ncbi:putative membrane protein [Caldibacillus thermoamylovorans]|uniref:Putative membrane protein n=1 Tax=Caldibacillus thermoamylovorans TaxID=35841 RepID=A0A090J306_9BACI|nr:GtrA family protein [Caldibacillus thermoamylovorans]CEE03048.1 putative membrane protein [Caldibacillus thermoamylovorans]
MKQFLKFGAVGILNTLISVVAYNILVLIGLNYIISNISGYTLGVLNSYYWNKNWVFKSGSKRNGLFLKFIAVNVISLGFNTLFLYILVDTLNFHSVISQLIATVIGMIINFVLNKKWAFESKESSSA